MINVFDSLSGNTNLLCENIHNKKVLVLGAGPSASEVEWTSFNWDVLVTANFFYLREEMLSKNIVHVTLSRLVDLNDSRLISFLDTNTETTIAFEPSKLSFYNSSPYKKFVDKYRDRIIFYNISSKVASKEGVAARVCWLVLSCDPDHLYICGIDGISKNVNSDPKNYFRNHRGTMDNYSYDQYYKSFQSFGKYLYTVAEERDIKITNLGKGKSYNMMTNISEQYEDKN